MHVPKPIAGAARVSNGTLVHPIAQTLIALAVVVVPLYLVATGQPVPPELWALVGLVIGYYFRVGAEAAAKAAK